MDKSAVFKEHLKNIYPQFPDILERHEASRPVTFRVSAPEKEQVLTTLKQEGFTVEKTPIAGFFTTHSNTKKLSESESFNTHKLYIQSLSSALPVLALQPKLREKVLDLCAAPGSKTTLIAHKMQSGIVVAVEKQSHRFYKLQDVLQKHTSGWVTPILADGTWITKKYPQYQQYFDAVLVDVPCSNEAGLEPGNQKSMQFWHPRKGKELSGTQKKLLASAFQAATPQGRVVYSTCTYNPAENELVVNWARKRFPEWHIRPSSLIIPKLETIPGFAEWNSKQLDPEIKNCLRILPNSWFSGFFITIFERT